MSGGGVIGDVVANGEVVSGREGEREGEGEGEEEGEPEGRRRDDVFAEQAAAPAAASRNHSIMRASGQSSTLSQPHMLYMYTVCMVTVWHALSA